MEILGPITIVSIIFYTFGFLFKSLLDHRARMKLAQMQTDIHTKLMDKFSSGQEISGYLEKAGAELSLLGTSDDARIHSYRRVQGALIAGAVLAAGGTGLLLAKGVFVDQGDLQAITVIGTLMASLGVGFLVAALATFGLSKHWGLINGQSGTKS